MIVILLELRRDQICPCHFFLISGLSSPLKDDGLGRGVLTPADLGNQAGAMIGDAVRTIGFNADHVACVLIKEDNNIDRLCFA